jgi:integrase
MSVRKRSWKTRQGETKEAWIVDYSDTDGDRHIETFERKKDADARHAQVNVNVAAGVHIAPSKAPTVKEASGDWLEASEALGLERATIKVYSDHVRLHIVPFIGHLKLSDLSVQVVRKFEDTLRQNGRSAALISMIVRSLGGILADAQERGNAAHNAVRNMHRNRGKRRNKSLQKRKLEIGVDIPSKEEVSAIIANANWRWRPLLTTAAFTGLRASELRGLRWCDVDLKANELKVRQRADCYNEIGKPKSEAGERTVPFGPYLSNTLKEWKLACPNGELVFPNGVGNVESLTNIRKRGLVPAIKAALGESKYTGMHCFRHFYASWCIDRGLPPKVIQERMGHASITLTFDRYGHLFPRADDSKEIESAELAVVNATQTRHAG